MAAVPEKVLNWLFSILANGYYDPNRTYSDVAETLTQLPSLQPRTEVYTHENGASELLLLLGGTVPVNFRGTVYRFPVAVWVPHAYPRTAPLVYVTPSHDMMIRPGQHVSGDGRVYHPYLAQWETYWDKSTILDFTGVLRDVFAKEPPVISKKQAQHSSPRPHQNRPPPPVPPTPEQWQNPAQRQYSPAPQNMSDPNQPPPLPPKPGVPPKAPQELPPDSGPPPPPRPPLPQHGNGLPSSYEGRAPSTDISQHDRNSSYNKPMPPLPPHVTGEQRPPVPPGTQYSSPVSPMTPENQSRRSSYHPQPPQIHPSALPQQMPPQFGVAPGPTLQPMPMPQVQQYAYPPNQYPPPHPQAYPPQGYPPQAQPPKPKQPAPDLLDSPLDVTLPSQTGQVPNIPAPPIPPNPEKDALLKALSSTLVSQTHQTLQHNANVMPLLQGQQRALQSAHSRLSSELHQLQSLDAALSSNESILLSSMAEADRSMSDAQNRKIPDVDEVLVVPTVVGNQLYTLCAEEKALGDAIFVLGQAVERGRVDCGTFTKMTRGLAREWFLKKALVRKVGRGMGLDERDPYRREA